MTPARHLWTLFEPLHAVTYFTPEGRAAFEAAGFRGLLARLLRRPLGAARPRAGGGDHGALRELRPADGRAGHPLDLGPRHARGGARGAASRARSRPWPGCSTGPAGGRGGRRPCCASVAEPRAHVRPRAGRRQRRAARGPTSRWGCSGRRRPSLRELRGDGHVRRPARGRPRRPVDTMVLRCGHDMTREALQPTRGWTDEEWDAGVRRRSSSAACSAPDGRITTDRPRSCWRRSRRSPTGSRRSRGTRSGPTSTARFVELADAARPRGPRRSCPTSRRSGCPSLRVGLAQHGDQRVRRRERRDRAPAGRSASAAPAARGDRARSTGSVTTVGGPRAGCSAGGAGRPSGAVPRPGPRRSDPTSECRRSGSGSSERSSTSSTPDGRSASRDGATGRPACSEVGDRAGPGQPAGEQLVGHGGQRVHVGAGVDAVAGDLLGRHVRRRPDHLGEPAGVQHRLGDAQVGDQQPVAGAAAAAQQQVLRLDVAVHDAELVQHRQPGRRLLDEVDDPRRRDSGSPPSTRRASEPRSAYVITKYGVESTSPMS